MNVRQRLLNGTDRLIAIILCTLIAGTALAFGGAVWWAGPAIAILTLLFVTACLARLALLGRYPVLKSPLTFLGVLAIGLAGAQLAPLPVALARRVSPRSQEVYAYGFFPARVKAFEASLELPEPAKVRSPVSIDRAATIRWIVGALVCLALFWGVSQFADRLQRVYLIWGSLVGVFFLNSVFAVVQFFGQSGGLYGLFEPGGGPPWIPSAADLWAVPNATVLRTLAGNGRVHPTWATAIPDRPFLIGTLMGGPGAFLALGALGLPLALALLLQLIAPRGSRERLRARLSDSGKGGLVILLTGLIMISCVLVGIVAGPILCLPFALALALVGLPSAWPSGLRWAGLGITASALLGLGSGVALRSVLRDGPGSLPPYAIDGLQTATRVWSDALQITRDFPVLGAGLGSFSSIYPFYKSRDEAQTTALSSVLQWWVESGAVGMSLLALGLLWCVFRLPKAVRRVGTADRALVFGLIGAAVGFSLYATIHWTVELAAVAIAASAVGGTCNRWLAGGTDLFVERG